MDGVVWSRRHRAVHVRARIPADDADMTEREPELLGCDDPRAGERARTDVLDPGGRPMRAVGVETYGRVGRRPAAAPPDLGGAPMPRSRPSSRGARRRSRSSQPGERGRAVVALQEMLARVGQAARLIDVDVVASPQLERIDVQRQRELVDRLLERRRAFHHARARETRSGRGGWSSPGTSAHAHRRSDRACVRGSARGTPSLPAPS